MVGFNIITAACSVASNIRISKLQWHFTYIVVVVFFLIGGLAGAASRITGAMAKGVAAITMDEDYQQKRREAMNKQPTGLREGITRGGKGLVSVRIKNDKKFNEFYRGKNSKCRGFCRAVPLNSGLPIHGHNWMMVLKKNICGLTRW